MKFTNIKTLLFSLLLTVTYTSYSQTATLQFNPSPTQSGNVYTVDYTSTINTANSALQSAEQAKGSAAIANATNVTQQKTIDSIVAKWPSGGGFTVPPAYNVSSSITIPQLPYNTDIFVKCNSCTVTFTSAPQSGWHYRLHNIGSTKINFAFTGVNKVNTLTSLSYNQRPVDITYQTSNTIEIH